MYQRLCKWLQLEAYMYKTVNHAQIGILVRLVARFFIKHHILYLQLNSINIIVDVNQNIHTSNFVTFQCQ